MWLPDCWPIVGMPVVVDTKMWLVDCWPIVNMPVVVDTKIFSGFYYTQRQVVRASVSAYKYT